MLKKINKLKSKARQSIDKHDGDLAKVGKEMEVEGKIEVAKAKLKGARSTTKAGASKEDPDSSSDEGSDNEVDEQMAREKAKDEARKDEFEEENAKAAEKNLKVHTPQHHAQHGKKTGFKTQAAKALKDAKELGNTLQRQSAVLKHANEALKGVKNMEAGI